MNKSKLRKFYKYYENILFFGNKRAIFFAFTLTSIVLIVILPLNGRLLYGNIFAILFSLYIFGIAFYLALQSAIAYYENNVGGAIFCLLFCMALVYFSFNSLKALLVSSIS